MLDRTLDGKYRLLRLLGQGGMGSVYEAQEIDTDRRVAIKVITDLARSSSPGALMARFRREARAAMAIDSPHVAKVLAMGIDPGTGAPFMVMEYLHGEDLDQVLTHVDPLPPALALRIVGQVCSGLQSAHEAGVVHRDIKPANIFVARAADAAIAVKILDFGIARISFQRPDGAESTRITHTGGVLGSPIFMSPEQALGSKLVDFRTDVWSLGVVLHRALTGRLHHEGLETVGQIIMAICSRPVRPVQEIAPWLSAEVAALVHRALEIDPDLRFPSSSAMLAAIEALVPEGFELREDMFVPLGERERAIQAPLGVTAISTGVSADALAVTALEPTSSPRARGPESTQEDPWEQPRPRTATPRDAESTSETGEPTSPERAALDPDPDPPLAAAPLAAPTNPEPVAPVALVAGGRLRSRWLPRIGAGLAVLLIAAVGLPIARRDSPPPVGTPRRLTIAPGWEAEPAPSPDGKLVAYASDEKGSADIWLVDAHGNAPLRLTDDPADDRSPTWFPDGSAIAFASDRGGQNGIWKVSQLGGSATPLVARALDPALSPDGTRIAFARPSAHGHWTIWVAPLADVEQAHALTSDEDGLWANRHPTWSPDGSTIAYQDFAGVWTVPAAGGKSRSLGEGHDSDSWPSWSPDGNHVYVASHRESTLALWRMPVRGGPAARLTLGTGPEVEPRVSRDGAHLAYSTYAEERALILIDLATGAKTRLPAVGEFAIAPDGRAIAYGSSQEGRSDLWIQALDGREPRGEPRRLTELPGSLALPAFSPDGQWIALHRVLDGQRDIWILPVKGGLPERFTTDPATDVQPTWAPDGSQIAFISTRSGKAQIWAAPVADGRPAGEARQVTFDETGKNLPDWSPDGRQLAYTSGTDDDIDIWIAPVAGGAPPRRLTSGAGAVAARWDRRGGGVFVSGSWGARFMTLRRVSLASGKSTVFEPEIAFGNVATGFFGASLDGHTLAVRREEARGDIWMLDASPGASY